MSSPVSTITSNVNLLLVDTYTIVNSNQPYVAYVSSVAVPGKIATVRDSTGNLGTNFFKIRVSTTQDVRFVDGTNFFDITQPFGYVTMSSRDKNTWNILNAYAFPDPYGISYVSTVNVRNSLNSPAMFASSFVSTVNINSRSISSFNIQATNNLFANSIDSVNINTVENIRTLGLIANVGFFSNTVNTYNLKISDDLTNTQIQNKNALLYIGNTLDMSSNTIQNALTVFTSSVITSTVTATTLYTSYINDQDINTLGGVNWSYYKAISNVDICGQELQNIQQTNKRKHGATNFGLPISYLETNEPSLEFLSDYTTPIFSQILYNQTGFIYRTINQSPFSKYLISIQFFGLNRCNYDFGTLWVYAGLSNGVNPTAYYGRTFNSNSPYQISSNSFPAKRTTFSYQDIIDFSAWSDGDTIYPVFYVVNNVTTDGNYFENCTFTYTLQPVFDSLV